MCFALFDRSREERSTRLVEISKYAYLLESKQSGLWWKALAVYNLLKLEQYEI